MNFTFAHIFVLTQLPWVQWHSLKRGMNRLPELWRRLHKFSPVWTHLVVVCPECNLLWLAHISVSFHLNLSFTRQYVPRCVGRKHPPTVRVSIVPDALRPSLLNHCRINCTGHFAAVTTHRSRSVTITRCRNWRWAWSGFWTQRI